MQVIILILHIACMHCSQLLHTCYVPVVAAIPLIDAVKQLFTGEGT